MRQFVELLGRTRKGDLTAQPQRLRYRPRRPAKLLYQLKSLVQGEKSPAHSPDSGDAFASPLLALRHGSPCACAFRSTSSSDHTLDKLPPRTSHLHAATPTPLASLPSTLAAVPPTCLPSHQNSLADSLPPTPTSPQISPLRLEQTSPLPLLASSYSPFAFPFFLFLVYLLSAFQKIWDAPLGKIQVAQTEVIGYNVPYSQWMKFGSRPCDCRTAVRSILYPWLFLFSSPLKSRRVEWLFLCIVHAITGLASIVNILHQPKGLPQIRYIPFFVAFVESL